MVKLSKKNVITDYISFNIEASTHVPLILKILLVSSFVKKVKR